MEHILRTRSRARAKSGWFSRLDCRQQFSAGTCAFRLRYSVGLPKIRPASGARMKISELRELLDQTSAEDIKRILIEVYRVLPKKTRENLAIDELLKNPGVSRADAKQAKALAQSVDINSLEAELEQFLSETYAQNYFAPNLYVPKCQRPKWRFKAKR